MSALPSLTLPPMPMNLPIAFATDDASSGGQSSQASYLRRGQHVPMSDTPTVLIVEDETLIAARIGMYLSESGYDVMGMVSRGEEAVAICQTSPPDVLLLDVQLKGELDGVQTAEAILQSRDIAIVYLTGNTDDETFARAKATRPHGFLSKPFEREALERAVALTVERIRGDGAAVGPLPEETEAEVLHDRIFVREKDRMVKVMLSSIQYIAADRAYCELVSAEQRYVLAVPLGRLEAQLPNRNFVRVHRSYLVNIGHIDAVVDDQVVIGKHEIPVSKTYRGVLAERLRLIS